MESNYLIERQGAFNEGVAMIHQDDPEGPNLESHEAAHIDDELHIACQRQLQRIQECKTEKMRTKPGTHARQFIPSEIKNYLLMKVLLLNNLTYTKTMLTGMPINLGGRSKGADWDIFILSVVDRDPKLKSLVLGFLPKCNTVKQFTQKLRESLILANSHWILFVAQKQGGKHSEAKRPKRLKRIAAPCEPSSSDEMPSDDEAVPPTPDQRTASPQPSKRVKPALDFLEF